jgi:glycosyltransferase involved in cell wall biosynthesis
MGALPAQRRQLGSVILPAFNESAVIAGTIGRVREVISRDLPDYDWEILVVDDGSTDDTVEQVRSVSSVPGQSLRLVVHQLNAGLGGALRTGFGAARGDVVVVLDSDLSYKPETLVELVHAWEQSRAHVVIASPYMPGGSTVGVPSTLERRSRIANRLLSMTALDDIHTLTGMVRAYDGAFLRALSLKAVDVDINVEILYKTQLLRGTIVEIPAVLDWSGLEGRAGRSNVMSRRSRWNTAKSLVMSYLFRPFWFPLAPAFLAAAVAAVLVGWGKLGWQGLAVVSVVLTSQLVTAALSMLQSKRYFEELFSQAHGPLAQLRPAESMTPAVELVLPSGGAVRPGEGADAPAPGRTPPAPER